MTPERSETINQHLVEEYYWAGELVVYVDHHLVPGKSFSQVCKELKGEADDPKGTERQAPESL